MHNVPKHNLEFQLTGCETNLRYLYGSDQKDPEVVKNITFMRSEIERIKKELAMQPGQPNWNVSKHGNDCDQWGIYDDNNNGAYVATVVGERNARLVAAAPDMLLLLKEIHDWTRYKNTPWARSVQNVLNNIEGIT